MIQPTAVELEYVTVYLCTEWRQLRTVTNPTVGSTSGIKVHQKQPARRWDFVESSQRQRKERWERNQTRQDAETNGEFLVFGSRLLLENPEGTIRELIKETKYKKKSHSPLS